MSNNDTVTCFVCQKEFKRNETTVNSEVLMPVCNNCKGTVEERKEIEKQIDSLSDGWFCGGM
ncbi:hypothetical protein EMN47_11905 [Prolixibacteraceae bacterium JC049]|nr:hypothetical protein [Prolixibacteraceae bacterium JC049]